ncbi:MAG: hypothetical protein O2968_21265, partial [Acidobacteria bacterium]|nr:hypothetical protein [Acidobacteriota bacterium]
MTYHRLAQLAVIEETKVVHLLSVQPRHIIKKALALTQLSFLRHYFKFTVSPDIEALLDELGPPEEIASIASALVAIANDLRPLDALDLGSPVMGDLASEQLVALMRCGVILVERRAIAKHISLFGYQLDERPGGKGSVFCVTPPYPEFERALRLGFVRGQSGSQNWLDTRNNEQVSQLSLHQAAEEFVTKFGDRLVELRDEGTESRRVRLTIPIIPTESRIIYRQSKQREDCFQKAVI